MSHLEDTLLWQIKAAGLPIPEREYRAIKGRRFRFDFAWTEPHHRLLVEGRLRPDSNGSPRTFQRKDGTWAASFEVTAENVRFLSGKADDAAPAELDIPF